MKASTTPAPRPVCLIWGEDDFAVKRRGREVFDEWIRSEAGLDPEIIDAAAGNGAEALTALGRLREALQTLPMFGGGRAVWFQNCSFLGDDRTAGSPAVTEALAGLAQELKTFPWESVRLLITAAKVDKRKSFYKTLEKIGTVETHAGWTSETKDWEAQAGDMVRRECARRGLAISEEATVRLVQCVGPQARLLASELEKLTLFAGDRKEITREEVDRIAVRNRQSRAFAVADAYGSRDLRRLVRALEEELWEMKRDSQKSEIGLLYGIIAKTRVMLFLKEMIRRGWIAADLDYARFKARLERVPREALPEDRRFNPLSMHPYMLFQALGQAGKYSVEELVAAMRTLLDCNRRLVSSALDPAFVLQQTLIKIVRGGGAARVA